jgi:hypothetical protein
VSDEVQVKEEVARTEKLVHVEGRFNGLPYRGRVLDLKNDDPPEKQPQLKHTVSVRMFDLTKEAELAEYQKICQGFADGKYVCSHEEIKFDEKNGTYKVFLRWMEPWYGEPLVIDEPAQGEPANAK